MKNKETGKCDKYALKKKKENCEKNPVKNK